MKKWSLLLLLFSTSLFAADWNKPSITDTYANYTTYMTARDTDVVKGMDPAVVSPTNVPTDAIRWNSASSKWEKYNGSGWLDLASTYAINVDKVDGADAGTSANNVLKLDGSGLVPAANLPQQLKQHSALNAAPVGWTSGYTLDLLGGGLYGTTVDHYFLNNLYHDGGWKYKGNGYGSMIRLENDGSLTYYNAANNSGGAGAVAAIDNIFSVLTSGAVVADGNLTIGDASTGSANIRIGPASPSVNGTGYIKFINSSTQKNWEISHNEAYDTAGALEFTPSTVAGGSTFTTPVLVLKNNGTLLSKKSCASGYTRLTPNYCVRNDVNYTLITSYGADVTIGAPSSDAYAVDLMLMSHAGAENSAGASRYSDAQAFSNTSSTNRQLVNRADAWEFTAVTAGFTLSRNEIRGTVKLASAGANFYIVATRSGSNSDSYYAIAGYYD